MVERQLRARGIRLEAVLDAMGRVPREEFLCPETREMAYDDGPVPILEGQTISQPFVVALMVEALSPRPWERALEIGTGSGYAAAVLASIVREVYTVERHRVLAETAAERLQRLGYTNVIVSVGDGTMGWREHAPYDIMLVSAAAPSVPEPLLEQLGPGGRLVIPVGHREGEQNLLLVKRADEGGFEQRDLGLVRFVPLVGRRGWSGEERAHRRGLWAP